MSWIDMVQRRERTQAERGMVLMKRMLPVPMRCRMQRLSTMEVVKNAVTATREGESHLSLIAPKMQAMAS